MRPPEMILRIYMPSGVFTQQPDVQSIVADTRHGSMGILSNRRDCVVVLGAGIFSYSTESLGDTFIAIDEGVLVKTGVDILVSTRRAIGGGDLQQLHNLVEEEFKAQDEEEKNRKITMLKLETGFLRRFAAFQHPLR